MMASCKPDIPDGIISEGKMEDILYDYHLAQGMAEAAPKEDGYTTDALLYEFQLAALKKHNVTEAEFDSSMTYYCSDLTRLNRIYQRVSERLEQTAADYGVTTGGAEEYVSLSATGDTANVWAARPLFIVKPNPMENLQSWKIECDSTWHPGDDVMWRFSCNLLSKNGLTDPLMFDLVIVYTNDSVRSSINSTRSSDNANVRVNTPYDWTPRTITGHLYLSIPEQAAARIFVVHHPMLVRFHKKNVHPMHVFSNDSGPKAEPIDSIQPAEKPDTVASIPAPDTTRLDTASIQRGRMRLRRPGPSNRVLREPVQPRMQR
ncbi:MAG: DUF4296 domain-containing protein [Bacteroidaceae bacterium]|nr:DUF4296 domain-containing protein [Bacteroidaceae bacterium]